MKKTLVIFALLLAVLLAFSSCDVIGSIAGTPDASSISISDDGFVVINGVKTEYHVEINDKVTVDNNGFLVVNGKKTEHKVHTKDEISVSKDGYLVVNGAKTEYTVDKEDVVSLDNDGYVVVNGAKTEYKVHTKDEISVGNDGYLIVNGTKTEYEVDKEDVVTVDADGYIVVNGKRTDYKAESTGNVKPDYPGTKPNNTVIYDGSPVTITFYHTMGSSLQQILNEAIADFNAMYPNITIEHAQVGNYDMVRDQIRLDLAVGNQPNIAYCYTDHIALYNVADAVQTLDEFINDSNVGFTQAELNDFITGFYEEGKAFGDGKMYSLPLSKSTEVLYYNKTFFEQNNLTVPTTWEEMAAVCEQIKEINPSCTPLTYDSEANWFITMCEQYGSSYTSATGENFIFDNDQNKQFVKMLREWYQNGWVTTSSIYANYTSELFTSANSYMCISSSGGASYHNPGSSFEVGIATLPQIDTSNPAVISQGPSVCVFKQDDPQEVAASWLFVKFLTTDIRFQASMSMQSGYIPVIKSAAEHPVYREFLNSASNNNLRAYAAKVSLEQIDAYFASPAFLGSSVARDQVGQLMIKCFLLPDANLDAAIDKAFKDAVDNCKYN